MMGHVTTGDDPLYILYPAYLYVFCFTTLSLNSGFKLGKLEER